MVVDGGTCPHPQRVHCGTECTAPFGESVGHADRWPRFDVPLDQADRPQFGESFAQNALREGGQRSMEFAESGLPLKQQVDDQARPPLAEYTEDLFGVRTGAQRR